MYLVQNSKMAKNFVDLPPHVVVGRQQGGGCGRRGEVDKIFCHFSNFELDPYSKTWLVSPEFQVRFFSIFTKKLDQIDF